MKKLLTFIGLLAIAALPASAQNFRSLNFFKCLTMTVSNTAAYTNIASYFGQTNIATTNANLFSYTNDIGTFITDYTSNTNTGPTATATGVVVYTNDQTQITVDLPLHSDGQGNVCSNYNISVAGSGNATSTNVVLEFAPILKGGNMQGGPNVGVVPPNLGSASVGTVLDLTNAFSIVIPTTKTGGYFTSSTNLAPCLPATTSLAGYRGLRLLWAANTNASGSTILWDVSLNTFIGANASP